MKIAIDKYNRYFHELVNAKELDKGNHQRKPGIG